jgi:hypothetical protein
MICPACPVNEYKSTSPRAVIVPDTSEPQPRTDESGGLTEMVTVSATLWSGPSLTTSCTTYAPGRSAMNDGETLARLLSAAALYGGVVTNAHARVIVSPSGSLEPLPFS